MAISGPQLLTSRSGGPRFSLCSKLKLIYSFGLLEFVCVMELTEAIKTLIVAIKNVESHYILVEAIPNTKVKKEQVERSFAYELYHQWSLLIEAYKKRHKGESTLLLNGEVSKHLDGRNTYPDMVLHGGQNNIENQLIVCEIKRHDKRYPSQKSVYNDIIKLCDYLNLTLPNENSMLSTDFQRAAFVMVNISEENLKDYLRRSLEPYNNREQYIKDNSSKILCISYAPTTGDNEREVLQEREVKCFYLSEIIN